MGVKKFLAAAAIAGLVAVGCSANTNVLCALAPYLPFNISACAPSATPTPVAAK